MTEYCATAVLIDKLRVTDNHSFMAVHHASLIDGVDILTESPRIAIITADFNPEITHGLLEKTTTTILEHRPQAQIDQFHVPGALEITGLAKMILEKDVYQCVIMHGCVIQGSTPHFDYVCRSVTDGYTALSLQHDIPLIFGVLTVDTLAQAQERVIDSYGIYALNALAQRQYAHSVTDTRVDEHRERVLAFMEEMEGLDPEDENAS